MNGNRFAQQYATCCRDVLSSTKAESVGSEIRIRVHRNEKKCACATSEACQDQLTDQTARWSQRDLRIKKNKRTKGCNREKSRASRGFTA